MGIIIQSSVKPGEIPALFEIEKECFTPAFRWSKSQLAAELPRCNVWVAILEIPGPELKTEIVGFLFAKIERGPYILTVEVPEQWRGQGIARRLVEACELSFHRRGYKQIRLEVFTDNPAQLMYFKLGYRVNGFRRDFYEEGKHALHMVKKL